MHDLVLIPGLGSDGMVWARTAAALSDDVRCTIGNTLEDDTLTGMAVRILADAPPVFALAGVSMGGMVAMEVARLAPDRLRRLALVGTNARPDTAEQADRRRRINDAIITAGSLSAAGGSNVDYLVHPSAAEDVRRDLIEMGARVGAATYVRQNEAVLSRSDQRPFLPAIDIPCAVIVGASDGMCPPALSEEIHRAISGSQLHVIPECGHLPPIEKPEIVAALLRALLSHDHNPGGV